MNPSDLRLRHFCANPDRRHFLLRLACGAMFLTVPGAFVEALARFDVVMGLTPEA